MSLEHPEPSWTNLSPFKVKKSLEMGNFGTHCAAKGVQRESGGRGYRGEVREECGRARRYAELFMNDVGTVQPSGEGLHS